MRDKIAAMPGSVVTRRALLGAGAAVIATRALAWPERPVRIIVPYAPGGGTDTFTRFLADALSSELGQPFVDKPGANGVIGSEQVARSQADGHTLLVVVGTHVLNRYVMPSLPFDPIADFTPIMRLCRTVVVLVSGRQIAFDSVGGMLAAARARPGTITIGHSEASTAYAGSLLGRMAGVELLAVPYRGGSPMMTDLIAGNLMTAFTSTGSSLGHIRTGRVRALSVTTPRRSVLLPDVPTIAEAACPVTNTAAGTGCSARRTYPARSPTVSARRSSG